MNCSVDVRTLIDVESLLVWTYARQRAHVVTSRVEHELATLGSGGTDSVVRVQRHRDAGGRISGGGPSCSHLHMDAEITAQAVAAHAHDVALLMRCAGTYSRPDWLPGAQVRPVPVRDARGRVLRAYEPWDRDRNYGWCRIDWPMTATRIAQARDAYAVWHADLVRIAGLPCIRALSLWRVTLPRAPAAPWLEKTP